jgi:hypothetical protein
MAGSNQSQSYGANKDAIYDPKKSGTAIPPGVYEAIVQGHVPGSRMGELFISIPSMSGIVANPESGSNSNQPTVVYCNPFYGTTFGADTGLTPDNPQQSGQSYGMWFVPPDIGNTVLVIYTTSGKGYWIGCPVDSPSHHMVPGIGRHVGGPSAVSTPPASDGINAYLNSSSNLPVVEMDISQTGAFSQDGAVTGARYPHEVQAMQYVMQGLDQDKVRGAISSSSLRECPSNVYGISTPGRSATKSSQVSGNSQATYFRTGGHSFVMDDGADGTGQDPAGTDQLIRLRTAGGHQILMNDTVSYTGPKGTEQSGILYIASKSGAQWLEFSADGSINIYGAAGFNLRSSGAINMHSDSAITMNSPSITLNALASAASKGLSGIALSSTGGISMTSLLATTIAADLAVSISAVGGMNISAGAAMKIGAIGAASLSAGGALTVSSLGTTQIAGGASVGLNCIPPLSVPAVPVPAVPLIPNMLKDTQFTGTGWVNGGTITPSICSVVPGHEPWVGSDGVNRPAPVSSLENLGIGLATSVVSMGAGTSGAGTTINAVGT